MVHLVDEFQDPVVVGLAFDQSQLLLVLVGVAEQSFASAEQEWKYEKVVAVDQPGVGEASAEGCAAMDDDRAAFSCF